MDQNLFSPTYTFTAYCHGCFDECIVDVELFVAAFTDAGGVKIRRIEAFRDKYFPEGDGS